MTTQEGNKLIAEFMGAILKPYPRDQLPSYYYDQSVCKTPTPSSSLWWGEWELQYHSSWDWLMPVVYKILFETETNTLDVYSLYVSDSLKTVNINDVWMAVIEFLQWYNQQGTKINR